MNLTQLVIKDKEFSLKISQWVNGRIPHLIVWLLARSGDSWFWILIIAYLMWQKHAMSGPLLVAALVTAVIVFTSKGIFKRERPEEFHLTIAADKYAFPSGHAARAGAIAVVFIFEFPALGLVWVMWAVLVSLARVALSRHYLMDVSGGLVLGIFVSLALQIVA